MNHLEKAIQESGIYLVENYDKKGISYPKTEKDLKSYQKARKKLYRLIDHYGIPFFKVIPKVR